MPPGSFWALKFINEKCGYSQNEECYKKKRYNKYIFFPKNLRSGRFILELEY